MEHDLIKILEGERAKLLLKLNLVEQTIIAYRHSDIISPHSGPVINMIEEDNATYQEMQLLFQKYQHYKPSSPTRIKIINIVQTENRFLHVREISGIAKCLENGLTINPFMKKISPALSMLKKMPACPLVSITVAQSHFNTFWGCKDWVTENGEIKEPFMYNENEIRKLRKNYFE